MAAYDRPADEPGIGLRVQVSPAGKGVHLVVRIDSSELLLRERDGTFTGSVTLLLSDRGGSDRPDASGLLLRPLGTPSVSTFALEMNAEQHEKMAREGVSIALDHPLGSEVRRVRLIVMDQNSNETGSLTFPVR